MTAARILGICGLAASTLMGAAGLFHCPTLLVWSGGIMVAGNLYAIWKG